MADRTENILVKPIDKFTLLPDYDLFLKGVWGSDSGRPWNIYSKQTFRIFWDDKNIVDLERSK